jgi:hypothetical protein
VGLIGAHRSSLDEHLFFSMEVYQEKHL